MEKGLFPWQGAPACGAPLGLLLQKCLVIPSAGTVASLSLCWALARLQQIWVSLPVYAPLVPVVSDMARNAWLILGLQDCESVTSWCLLLRSYSNFPTIKSAVEFGCSALCCVSMLE